MITGNPPYYADDIKTMYRNIEEGNLEFPEEISEEAQNLIRVQLFIFKKINSFY